MILKRKNQKDERKRISPEYLIFFESVREKDMKIFPETTIAKECWWMKQYLLLKSVYASSK